MKGKLESLISPRVIGYHRKLLNAKIVVLLLGILAGLLAFSQALAVSPPPDGGYAGDNTAEGEDALFSLTTGISNTAIGFNALYRNTDGSGNTAVGWSTLFNNSTGYTNTATGIYALLSNATGFQNTAYGGFALLSNTTGFQNSAQGDGALASNTTGFYNTASGSQSLHGNTIGTRNTANGVNALNQNTTGTDNTAIGVETLSGNTTGGNNSASGQRALGRNTTGSNNTANGQSALRSNTTGDFNIGIGANAGRNLTTGSNNIDIGNHGVPDESNTIRIGIEGTQQATYIAGINATAVPDGVGVVINSSGQLGTIVSSERFKSQVKPMNQASEAILLLQPVTFRYKEELDPDAPPQFGLVAEEVAKVSPDLVARDKGGKPYSVRYEAVNAMLLNEFLKEHRRVEEQVRINREQEATIAELKVLLKEQSAQIQQVRAELAVTETRSQLVAVED